jgi:hypothetical protein
VNKSYEDKYVEAKEMLATKQKALKAKALKLLDVSVELEKAVQQRNAAQVAEQLWHDNKDILAILLEQRAREVELDLILSAVVANTEDMRG